MTDKKDTDQVEGELRNLSRVFREAVDPILPTHYAEHRNQVTAAALAAFNNERVIQAETPNILRRIVFNPKALAVVLVLMVVAWSTRDSFKFGDNSANTTEQLAEFSAADAELVDAEDNFGRELVLVFVEYETVFSQPIYPEVGPLIPEYADSLLIDLDTIDDDINENTEDSYDSDHYTNDDIA